MSIRHYDPETQTVTTPDYDPRYASLDEDGLVLAEQLPPGGGAVPTGTGWRHVTDGEEDEAASTPTASDVGACADDDARLSDARTPTTHGNGNHSSTFITADDLPAIPAVANAGEVADCSTVAESDGTSDRYARADHVHKYVDTSGEGGGSLGWGLW